MVRFEYVEPNSIQEAVAVLSRYGNEAKVLAGGTDLLAQLKECTLKPRFVVNIKRLGLEGIAVSPDHGVRIGALTTLHAIEVSPLLREKYSALTQAAHLLGSPQVRNLATVGGNLCHAAPSAETAAPLLSFSASVRMVSPQGERVLPLDSFFTGPGTTILKDGDLVTEIILPDSSPGTRSAYLKHCPRGSMDIAVVGVAAMLVLSSEGGTIERCRIGLGAVAPTPIRAKGAEELLKGKKPTEQLIQEAAEKAAAESDPISDIRATADYRRQMVRVLTTRALKAALEGSSSRNQKHEALVRNKPNNLLAPERGRGLR